MRRLLALCALSVILYGTVATLADRPLTLGPMAAEAETKLGYGASIPGPKLVILAGSNGPYSHRCEILARDLGRACVNAGVAVGLGLDYLFARWTPLLRPGDAVYMPLELSQYSRTRAQTITGPDAQIMWRHDWRTLKDLAPDRWPAALFSTDLRGLVSALAETAFSGVKNPDLVATDIMGDHVGHTAERAARWQATLAAYHPAQPDAAKIGSADGAREVARFLVAMRDRGVTVIGGLPTRFDDLGDDDAVAAVRALYEAHGAAFLTLPNLSRYPRGAFYDTADHLNETFQRLHTQALAALLAARLSPARLAQTQQRPLDPDMQ